VLGRIALASPSEDWLADLAHSNPGINATIIGEHAFGAARDAT
jgi:hypothetical protein